MIKIAANGSKSMLFPKYWLNEFAEFELLHCKRQGIIKISEWMVWAKKEKIKQCSKHWQQQKKKRTEQITRKKIFRCFFYFSWVVTFTLSFVICKNLSVQCEFFSMVISSAHFAYKDKRSLWYNIQPRRRVMCQKFTHLISNYCVHLFICINLNDCPEHDTTYIPFKIIMLFLQRNMNNSEDKVCWTRI